jgi:uncharacterized protein
MVTGLKIGPLAANAKPVLTTRGALGCICKMDYWGLLAALFCLVALLYGAVGHGGASGYLAVMALAGVAPAVMKPTALTLNLMVSAVSAVWFYRAGHFRWRIFWLFACMAVPCAYLGGRTHLSPELFRWLLAGALAVAATRLLWPDNSPASNPPEIRPPALALALALGAVLGLVSGLIGVGGGIFLTPLLLLCRWAEPKVAAAVSAPFIFVNSAAGLAGAADSLRQVPTTWPWLALAVVGGGMLGARWGAARARANQLRPVLAGVLALAALKLVIR